ncbi:hypothetical protein SAMN05660766_0224 [Curtobacterium sp. 314Chir4.1]|uniref:hypothetical protein n=1 Tax=Curtobacterium sp. 314Chir4.1 TaxID=1279028 RepID=UPI000BCE9BB1|nr:hypothetical protein [Curtobacterium sp. 314Chir4.1]SOC86572.1 hypothetical protein SAMN05660766_0224 [Curtobacterium sp. 314Chir4.1]
MRDDDIDDTVIRRPRAQLSGDRVGDALDDTVIRAAPTAPAQPDADADDDTVIRPVAAPRPTDDGLDDTIVRVPARPDDSASASVGAEPRLQAVPPAPQTRVPSIRIGERVLRLDHPVIVGRRPTMPRILRGAAPELVTVPSATGQVSSSHVLVHAEGEATVVDDLRSTNGTVVRPAGAAPFRMPSGASNVVLTGTVVEIGDGNVIEVLSPYHRVAPTAGDIPPLPVWPSDPPAGTPRTPRERS